MTEITTEQALKALEAERNARLKRCQEEMSSLLETHGCELNAQIVVVDGRLMTNIVLVVAPPKQ